MRDCGDPPHGRPARTRPTRGVPAGAFDRARAARRARVGAFELRSHFERVRTARLYPLSPSAPITGGGPDGGRHLRSGDVYVAVPFTDVAGWADGLPPDWRDELAWAASLPRSAPRRLRASGHRRRLQQVRQCAKPAGGGAPHPQDRGRRSARWHMARAARRRLHVLPKAHAFQADEGCSQDRSVEHLDVSFGVTECIPVNEFPRYQRPPG